MSEQTQIKKYIERPDPREVLHKQDNEVFEAIVAEYSASE